MWFAHVVLLFLHRNFPLDFKIKVHMVLCGGSFDRKDSLLTLPILSLPKVNRHGIPTSTCFCLVEKT